MGRSASLLVLPLLALAAACHSPRPARGEVHGIEGKSLDRYLTRLEAFGFSGSVLVARHGQLLLDKGYGLADRERGRPYTADTIFDIASISKQFTAAAILKLEQEGRLRVEDPIGKFFRFVPADKQEITLHQLLTHTAGFPESLGGEYDAVSRGELVRRALATDLLRRPGRKFWYSNLGYSLLAAVVEIASGERYEDYLHQRLFAPAGMGHTGFHVPDRDRIAHGYTAQGDWGTPLDHPWAADGPYWNLRGNGGILTTTGDLYRWHQALQAGHILNPDELRKATFPYVSEGRKSHAEYAYGWSVVADPKGGRELSHIGGNLVFDSDFRRYLDADTVLIVSSNSTDFSAIPLAPHLENRLFGLPDPEPPAAVPADPARLAAAAGIYALPEGDRLAVRVEGGHLAVTALGTHAYAPLLGPLGDDDRELMEERLGKIAEMLTALEAGDAGPLAALRALPPEPAAAEGRALLAPWLQKLGAWQGSQVLGNGASGGHPYTYARLTFARGVKIAEVLWSGLGIEEVRFRDAPPALPFLPQEDGSYAGFNAMTGATLPLRIEAGTAAHSAALVVGLPGAEARAERIAAR